MDPAASLVASIISVISNIWQLLAFIVIIFFTYLRQNRKHKQDMEKLRVQYEQDLKMTEIKHQQLMELIVFKSNEAIEISTRRRKQSNKDLKKRSKTEEGEEHL